jgi:hypothetical protein
MRLRTIQRTAGAFAVPALGAVMGVLGAYVSIFPPTGCGRWIWLAVFALLLILFSLAVFVPAYRKERLNEPMWMFKSAIGVMSTLTNFIAQERAKGLPQLEIANIQQRELIMAKYNQRFTEFFRAGSSAKVQALLDALRINGRHLANEDGYYLRPLSAEMAMVNMSEIITNIYYLLNIPTRPRKEV